MTETIRLTWQHVNAQAQNIAQRNMGRYIEDVYGIPQGGAPVALLVAQHLDLPVADKPAIGTTLIVDDLVDTGRTLTAYKQQGYIVDAAYRKPHSPATLAPDAHELDAWLTFPWERDDGDPTDAVIRLLQHIGEDPSREGLLDTPKRVVKALRELTEGYDKDPAVVLGTTFLEPHDEMIVVSDIEFASMCEHHMLPFTGTATVGYIPSNRIVGLSKIPRLVDMYARRLQVQERMTNQIAHAINDILDPLGVGVVVHGTHSCCANRGVRKKAPMTTSCLIGAMRDEAEARQEFLHIAL
jgi:GTP cyclohydrolase I